MPLGLPAHRDVTPRQTRKVLPFGRKIRMEVMWSPEQGQPTSPERRNKCFVENGTGGGRTVLCVAFNTMTYREQVLKNVGRDE